MSIPRDLKVEIPGYGTGKFNEAYSYGGPKLTLQTVKQLTGLPINHVVNIDFLGFVQARLRDRLRLHRRRPPLLPLQRRRAGHPNSTPKSTSSPATSCSAASKALDYVRYRHTDTDLVRSARQQDFISAARQRVSVQDTGLRPGRTDRHLHQIHHLRHQRQGDDAGSAEAASSPRATRRSRRSTSRPNSGPASSTRRRKRSTKRSSSSSGSKPAASARGSLEDGEEAAQGQEEERQEGEEGQEEGRSTRRSRTSKSLNARQRRPGAGPRSGRSRGEDRRAQARARGSSRSSTRPGCRQAPSTSKATPTKTSSTPTSTTSRTTRRGPPRRLPHDRGAGTVRRHPLLRHPGDPRLVGPADPRRTRA